jgi:hypothetical protein
MKPIKRGGRTNLIGSKIFLFRLKILFRFVSEVSHDLGVIQLFTKAPCLLTLPRTSPEVSLTLLPTHRAVNMN